MVGAPCQAPFPKLGRTTETRLDRTIWSSGWLAYRVFRGRDRLVEETVVRARLRATVRERPPGERRGGEAASAGGSRIEIGSVAGLNRRQADALRGGTIAIDAHLDLHGFSRKEAGGEVAAFLARSARGGLLRCVLVITGQGRRDPLAKARGVLRGGLERWLNEARNPPARAGVRAPRSVDTGARGHSTCCCAGGAVRIPIGSRTAEPREDSIVCRLAS